jgi:hypothetical protein
MRGRSFPVKKISEFFGVKKLDSAAPYRAVVIASYRLEGHLDLSLALECIITDADTDDDRYSITVMSKNTHNHEDRSETSPVRQSVSELAGIGLTETQIRLSLAINYPTVAVSSTKLPSFVQTERRKDHPEIFSVYDFPKWYNDSQDFFVPFYFINKIKRPVCSVNYLLLRHLVIKTIDTLCHRSLLENKNK